MYLQTLLDRDGHRDSTTCWRCGRCEGMLRCMDCFGGRLECKDCILIGHRHLPFHRLECWNGQYFAKSSLFDQGFVIHVGHGGAMCPTRHQGQSDIWEDLKTGEEGFGSVDDAGFFDDDVGDDIIVVVDTTGIFHHRVAWCGCNKDYPLQLFQEGLFPASFNRPKTAFTFRVLDYFYVDAMECKTAAMSFYQKLQRLTDNAFPSRVKVSSRLELWQKSESEMSFLQNRYRELMRVSRQWRDLLVRKRFGYGHETDKSPGNGDLALFCPACPQPGINIPSDWQTDPDRWVLYHFTPFLFLNNHIMYAHA